MDEYQKGNPELDSGGSGRKGKKSPVSEFLLFLFIFGWSGPFAILFGFQKNDGGIIVAGIFLTLFFWWLLPGFSLLKDFVKHLSS